METPFPLRTVLGAVLLALAAACGGAEARPHVVLIVVDTLRADRLSCYGRIGETSPELDELAANGVRFERVVAQSSWTRPSMGSMLTSRYPRALGIVAERGDALPRDVETLAEAFARAGYTTVGATANPNVNAAYEFDQGFDRHFDSEVLWRWMPHQEGKTIFDERAVQDAGEVFGRLLEAVDEAGPSAGPFYLQANVMDVHEYFDERRVGEGANPEDLSIQYDAAVRFVSRAIGAFLEALAARPGWEDRIVVVTSDHGEGLGDHPHVPDSEHHGTTLYESQLLVPWILADPGDRVPERLVVERPVRLLDLAPTLLELAGAPPLQEAEGLSLAPLLRGDEVELPAAFPAETFFRNHDKGAMWSDGWLFVQTRDGHPGTNRIELQATGKVQDGARTSLSLEHPEELRRLAEQWRTWSDAHPLRPPTRRTRDLSDADVEQLRALGYVGEE